ncbi:hypothetical protein [Natronoglycomyces albus]|uniref:Uncharacterized protein n=1 Tax=Natronoglycomyces albus TaxID=2811108 RepID=A0A895XQQ4_9ACTN|nr:hypothetical protein [Natronoglycomyces albus]QSB04886.1 hypothetical protein JQS30_14135 [Natronoglycomyces albus]
MNDERIRDGTLARPATARLLQACGPLQPLQPGRNDQPAVRSVHAMRTGPPAKQATKAFGEDVYSHQAAHRITQCSGTLMSIPIYHFSVLTGPSEKSRARTDVDIHGLSLWLEAKPISPLVIARFRNRAHSIAAIIRFYGQLYSSRSGTQHFEPEICIEVGRKYAPQWEMLRSWCGAEAQARHDELAELRGEVARLSGLVAAAITELDKSGSQGAARRIESELIVPLKLIRASQRLAHR